MDDDFSEGMEDHSSEGQEGQTQQDDHEAMVEEGKAAAILAYIPFLCFVPLIKMRDNPFALRHGKQGLLLFLAEAIAVFFTFDAISDLFWGMVLLLSACVAIVGIVYSVQGKEFTIPYVGKLAEKLKI